MRPNPAEQLDSAVPGAAAPAPEAHPCQTLVAPHPEPVRREARIGKPFRRHLPWPEEEVVVRPAAAPKPGNELAQLHGILTLCTGLPEEVANPDAEWARELLPQMRTEFERQGREQRKVLQQLIAAIKELMERMARRGTPEEPDAKRTRPLSVDICPHGEEGAEISPTILVVAEPSGTLGIPVVVPLAELAEPRSTPRATESVKASEEAPPMKFPSQPRSFEPSPSPTAEVRLAEERTPVSVVSAAPRSSAAAGEVPSEAAVQNAVRQLLAIFAAARHLRTDVGRRDSLHFEDGPRDRRGRPVHEEFVPALWGAVRRSSLRAVRLGRTPER